jgi:hypothetical protein
MEVATRVPAAPGAKVFWFFFFKKERLSFKGFWS